ncbi:MAG: hypothetical protein HY437_01885 [Candidatus Magasanikbacteria bacterium]|nr:hypothetical protein [Candidatus Magasanikbacteria bacterium]
MRTSSETKRSLPPADPPDDERTKTKEIERLLDVHIEELLDRVAFKINEGNNGVIFRVPVFEVPPALKDALRESGVDLETDRVFKVLKVYAPGVARREFEMQQRAYLALEQARQGGEQVARIPKPFFARDISVAKTTAEKLRRSGSKIEGNKAGVIMMDFAEGEDLATLLYKEALRRRGYEDSLIENMPLDEIMEQVASQLKFNRPGGKGRSEAEREFEKRKIEMENADKLFAFLANAGFKIDAALPTVVERTIRTLHAAGLLWRDGHERNIMIHGSLSGSEAPTVHIIDFGGSRTFAGKITPELYQDETPFGIHQSRDDLDVVRVLRQFVEKRENGANGGAALPERARARIEKDKFFKARVEGAGSGERALKHGLAFYGTGDQAQLFPLFAFALLEKGRVSREQIHAFAAAQLERPDAFSATLIKPLQELLAATA